MDEIASVPCRIVPQPMWPAQALRMRERQRRVRRALRVGVGLATVAALLLTTSFVLRSEWFLRQRIDPKLEELGQRLHGEFSYESVSAAGLTGVVVEGLTFEPRLADSPQVNPLRIERLVVYPDLGAMFVGDLQARSLEVHGLTGEFWLDGGTSGRGHWPWLEQVVDTWTRTPPDADGGGGGGDAATSLPEIRILGGRLDVVSPGGTMPHIGASVDDLLIHAADGQLRLDGAIHVDGLGYALLSGGANRRSRSGGVVVELVDSPDLLELAPPSEQIRDLVGPDSRLEVDGVSVRWPPAVTVHGARITDTRIRVPGHEQAWVETIGVGELTVRFAEERAEIEVIDLDAGVRVEWFEALGTSLPLRLPRLDAVVDFGQRRIGAGFQVATGRGHLSLEAALDLRSLDLAVQVEAERFDAGRMLSFVPYTGPLDVSSGIVSGHVRLRYPLLEELMEVDAELELSELSADVPWVAEQPLENAQLGIDVHSIVDLRERTLRIDDGRMSLGELDLSLQARVEQLGQGRDVRVTASMRGEKLSGAAALASLPRGFAPALEGYALDGHFGVALELALDTGDVESMVLDYRLDLDALRVVRHGPYADIPVLDTDAFAVRVRTASDGTVISPADVQGWTPLFRVPRHVVAALIASEDGRFYHHNGFDSRAIHNSLVANLSAGRIVRGGSTISQQVVKNLFLSQSKTVSRKLQEAFLTWQLETHVDKQRILELYVNLAHWGPDIYGISEAARHYFDKRPSQLTVRESLFLAAILPNPVRFGRQYQQGVIQADRLTKMRSGLLALYRRGLFDRATYERDLDKLGRAIISNQPPPPLPPPGQVAQGG